MLLQTKDEHIDFLRKRIIEEVALILEKDLEIFSVMVMAQAVEVLGAYLDEKPLRAKAQSSKRFALALYRLFPSKYARANKKSFLYVQLRTSLTHMFIPSSLIIIKKGNSINSEFSHLEKVDDKLIIFIQDFYKDLCNATDNLIYLIEKDIVKPKKISTS